MIKSYKFSKRHLLVWLTSLLGMAGVWYMSALMMLFLENNAEWDVLLLVFVVALIPAFLSQLGLIISPLLENSGNILLRLFSLVYMSGAVCILTVILADIMKGLAFGGLKVFFVALLLGVLFVTSIFALQIAVLMKCIILERNIRRTLYS